MAVTRVWPLSNTIPAGAGMYFRFGAEDLFKAAEEGSAERSRRLLEEDIDDILQRAEVVEQGPAAGGDGAAADLLSSFNVATFKVCLLALSAHTAWELCFAVYGAEAMLLFIAADSVSVVQAE